MKTAPSVTDAAVGRIAQSTKVIAEGGYEKVFRQSFETVPEEKLLKSYACYLSTSAGPVMGVMYLSTAKLAFCSDNPLSYKNGEETQWSYYKVHWFVLMFISLDPINRLSCRAFLHHCCLSSVNSGVYMSPSLDFFNMHLLINNNILNDNCIGSY